MTHHAPASEAHRRRVVVIGGGLAGLAAAVRLAHADVPVTLIETRKHLGGRAGSFTDPATGHQLDNCQHVLTPACTNLLDLYHRLGVDGDIDWHPALHFVDEHGRCDALEADDIAAPLHLLRPLLSMQSFTWPEKWALLRGLSDLMQITPAQRQRYEEQTFLEWLNAQPQPASVIEKFWSLIVTSACNETVDRVAASHAIHVFQQGMLSNNRAYEIGLPHVPLARLYDTAHQQLERAGGVVVTGTAADRLLYENGRITIARLVDQQEIAGDAFIAAVPPDRLARLVDDQLIQADPRLQDLDQFEFNPILGIHLFLEPDDDQPLMNPPFAALMNSPLHWVFNKGPGHAVDPAELGEIEQSVTDAGEQRGTVQTHYLHGVISAAHAWVDLPADQVIEMAMKELRQRFPATRRARLVHGRVIKEKRATVALRPGVDAYRPSIAGRTDNLYLAGDWTATSWPATMEGAVRSGYLAAAAILRQRGIEPDSPLAPELETSLCYRLLAG